MSRQPVLLDDRIRDQRVRRPERSVERGRREAVAEREHEQEAENEGQCEGERAERQRRLLIALELVEIELEPCDEHEEEQAERTEGLDDPLTVNPVEHERPDQHPSEHDPDQSRKPEALGDDRPCEQNDRRNEERPLGRLGRELDGQRHAESLTSATDDARGHLLQRPRQPNGRASGILRAAGGSALADLRPCA
jgi:hypothetical protein